MSLEYVGDDRTEIVFTDAEGTREVGDIRYIADIGRHRIEWNEYGHDALEQYKRDAWNTTFYSALHRWRQNR